jgi:hypothetical protein
MSNSNNLSSNYQIIKNLKDQSQNFGQELVVQNNGGVSAFVDPNTGMPVSRGINAAAYQLQQGPLDNSFQLDPNQYAVSVAMFQKEGVPTNLSNTFGAIAAATAQSMGVSAGQIFNNGVMSNDLLDIVNGLRDATSQIGYNTGVGIKPYNNNFLLGAKILNQTS